MNIEHRREIILHIAKVRVPLEARVARKYAFLNIGLNFDEELRAGRQELIDLVKRLAPIIVLSRVSTVTHGNHWIRMLVHEPVPVDEDVLWVLETDGRRIPTERVVPYQNFFHVLHRAVM